MEEESESFFPCNSHPHELESKVEDFWQFERVMSEQVVEAKTVEVMSKEIIFIKVPICTLSFVQNI